MITTVIMLKHFGISRLRYGLICNAITLYGPLGEPTGLGCGLGSVTANTAVLDLAAA